jgi:hypothetical protein
MNSSFLVLTSDTDCKLINMAPCKMLSWYHGCMLGWRPSTVEPVLRQRECIIDPDDGSSKHFCNIDHSLRDSAAQQTRRQSSA